MKPAPIIIFVYNRPNHLRRTLQSLSDNPLAAESDLFVFSDGAKTEADESKVNEVRYIIRTIEGFREVIIYNSYYNKGLANSIIEGVSETLSVYEKVIVLEDDLIVSRNFLTYMNTCLDLFKHRTDIASISGYTPPIVTHEDHSVYLSCRPGSWGWGTWRDRWDKIYWKDSREPNKKKFNRGGDDLTRMFKQQRAGKIDSWAVRWAHHNSRNSLYTVYPCVSKVLNIGTSEGTHFKSKEKRFDVVIDQNEFVLTNADIQPSDIMMERFRKFWKYTLWKRFKLFILDLIN